MTTKVNQELKNCWEILECGRERNGSRVAELGECVASTEGMGHNRWIVAGTFGQGKVESAPVQKLRSCTNCKVFQRYNRLTGTDRLPVRWSQAAEIKAYKNRPASPCADLQS